MTCLNLSSRCLSASEARRRSSDTSPFTRPATDDTLVDSSLNTVKHLEVQLGELVFLVGRRLLDITQGRCVHDVPDDEPLDGLVLRDSLSGRDTPDTLDVSASLLVPSVVASLNCHGSNVLSVCLFVSRFGIAGGSVEKMNKR